MAPAGLSGMGAAAVMGLDQQPLSGIALSPLFGDDQIRLRQPGRKSSMAVHKRKNSCLVYSTDQGEICPGCGHPVSLCACSRSTATPKGDGIVRISRQTKGRKGKGVSCITGVPLSGEKLEALARQLKQRCGAGGAVKDGVIEIQGDHRETLVLELKKLGYSAKLAGG